VLEAVLLILIGLAGLGLGGELLVRGSVAIAKRLGVSDLATGLIIVGFATSMPEMVASLEAALVGSPGIAWGNIVGSNLANTLLILGITSLIAPVRNIGSGKRDAFAALALTLVFFILGFSQLAHFGIGLAMLTGVIIYVILRYKMGSEEQAPSSTSNQSKVLPFNYAIILFGAGLVSLIYGGQFLVSGGIDLARLADVSETVIGLTVVAVGTSLPELAASVAAAIRGRSGLALGNILGSNIYNILLIGGATMFVAPSAIPPELQNYDIWLLLISAVLLYILTSKASQIGPRVGLFLVMIFSMNVILAFI
jgi:cation:H+ antiporter